MAHFDEKTHFRPLKDVFFVIFNNQYFKPPEKLIQLYVAHFDEKNTLLTLKRFFVNFYKNASKHKNILV